MRATTLARFVSDSSTVGSRPTSVRRAATCSAAWRSPGPELSPRLEVSILIRSRHSATTSSWAVRPVADALLTVAGVLLPAVAGFCVTTPWCHPALVALRVTWGTGYGPRAAL